MADTNRDRPLSPFMIGPYYRPQMTSMSSIMVRITGIVSFGTAFLVVCWLLAAAFSESAFNSINWLLTAGAPHGHAAPQPVGGLQRDGAHGRGIQMRLDLGDKGLALSAVYLDRVMDRRQVLRPEDDVQKRPADGEDATVIRMYRHAKKGPLNRCATAAIIAGRSNRHTIQIKWRRISGIAARNSGFRGQRVMSGPLPPGAKRPRSADTR